MRQDRIVSEVEWLAARKQHLDKEKGFTRLRDDLCRQRRELPWVSVEKSYTFVVDHIDGPLVHLNARDVTLLVGGIREL